MRLEGRVECRRSSDVWRRTMTFFRRPCGISEKSRRSRVRIGVETGHETGRMAAEAPSRKPRVSLDSMCDTHQERQLRVDWGSFISHRATQTHPSRERERERETAEAYGISSHVRRLGGFGKRHVLVRDEFGTLRPLYTGPLHCLLATARHEGPRADRATLGS